MLSNQRAHHVGPCVAELRHQDDVLAAIDRLTVQRGTSLARGIEASLKVIVASANPTLSLAVNRTGTPAAT